MEWPLSQMDRQVGVSFTSHFHFALAALLYRGFSHPLSTVRTRVQDLITTLFFIHSPKLNSTLRSVYRSGVGGRGHSGESYKLNSTFKPVDR